MRIVEQISTPVTLECDVLVCGGGFAGVAAALAARRQGKEVLLIEKNYMLGGLGTAGLVTIYLPLCDGRGHQVSYGIAEELLRLSIRDHCEGRYPENWIDRSDPSGRTESDARFMASYNAALCARALEQQLADEGVEIRYGTYAVRVVTEDSRIRYVITESRDGRSAIRAGSVVDATGDADIAALAGVPCNISENGNILASWYYAYCREHGYRLVLLGGSRGFAGEEDELRFTGMDAKNVTEFLMLSRKVMYRDVAAHRQTDPSYVPAAIPSIPEFRMTRKLIGNYVLDESEAYKTFDTSIGMVSDWRNRGPVFEIPFETLYSGACRNLICAGRCTSVTEDMWDIMRVIPCCAVTGQAAGTAAALTDDFSSLDRSILQKRLMESGVKLHPDWTH